MSFIPVHTLKLRQALQMAVLDLEEGHAPDPFRYSDYNLKSPSFLGRIELNLRRGFIRPSPPLELTFPKSEFAVRPGRRIELEDLVVLYYCLLGLIGDLEDKLKPGVTAYRVRKGNPPSIVERTSLILPRYLRRQLRIIDPWYDAWPAFLRRLRREYTRYGRRFVGTSDITSFYEDVDLDLLRDVLSRVRRVSLPFVNKLVEMYQGWSSRDVNLVRQGRGLPQGTNSSGVVANYYLIPFDDELHAFAKRKGLRWYRYNDDMRLLGTVREDVQIGLRTVGQHLSRLNLIQQGSKTKILVGEIARAELFDTRPEKIGLIVKGIQKKKALTVVGRNKIEKKLDSFLSQVGEIPAKNDSRILAMLYGAYGHLNSDRLLRRWKRDYLREPTRARTILAYVSHFLDRPGQCSAVVNMVKSQRESATDWEIAQFLRFLRFMRYLPEKTVQMLLLFAQGKTTNWYVRQQAVVTIGWFNLRSEARALSKILFTEWDDEVRRAICCILFLMPPREEKALLDRASQDPSSKVGRMANYLLKLRTERDLAESSLRQFKNPNETFFTDSFWRLHQIKWNRHVSVSDLLEKCRRASSANLKGKFARAHLVSLRS